MANRDPKQCAKAVQGFWNNERDLIKQGQGTRDWSFQEQIEIMNFKPSGGERKNAAAPTYGQGELGEYGMNYDKYEGQHMKSAEAHPEFQGDPNNIQALTRGEHQKAHGGDFRNPTNGYYNPETGEMSDFGNNPPENIQPQQLSEAYVDSVEYQYIVNSMDDQQAQKDIDNQVETPVEDTQEQLQDISEQTENETPLESETELKDTREQLQEVSEQTESETPVQDTAVESENTDALSAYEQKQTEMQNPSDDNVQDVLNDFEQNKAEMQNPSQDNYENVLNDFDQRKEEMQDVDKQQDVSQNASVDNEQTVE